MSEDRPFMVIFGKAKRRAREAPRAALRTARKELSCEAGCGDPIAPGDTYRDLSSMRLCLGCWGKRFPEATS